MSDIVLIAGTHHGGWYWETIAESLKTHGHRVFTPTLSGLDATQEHEGSINLDTHINDVLSLIVEENISDLVLVAHSYAGMVITGVADRTNAFINRLVFIDAALPAPGQSEWDLNSQWLRDRYVSSTSDGVNIDVPYEFLNYRPRVMPHPLATKLQPLFFSQSRLDGINKIYVHAANGFGPGMEHFFEKGYQRALVETNWTTHVLQGGHDLPTECREEIIQIILEAAKS